MVSQEHFGKGVVWTVHNVGRNFSIVVGVVLEGRCSMEPISEDDREVHDRHFFGDGRYPPGTHNPLVRLVANLICFAGSVFLVLGLILRWFF
jgi:hypothetical protein